MNSLNFNSRYQILRAIVEECSIEALTNSEKLMRISKCRDAYLKLTGIEFTADRLLKLNTRRWKYRLLAQKREKRLDRIHQLMERLRNGTSENKNQDIDELISIVG